MTPPPNLQDLIDSVLRDAPGENPLDQLATASATVATLDETTDALLSHFVDRARRNGHSWSEISAALGVSKQAAHKRFSTAPSLERLTPRTRQVLEHAQFTVGVLGHAALAPEHLLMAIFEVPECLAAVVLRELGIERDVVAAAVLERAPRGDHPAASTVTYSPAGAALIGQSLTEALALGHNYVGTEHVLLALFHDPRSVAAQALSALGVERPQVQALVLERLRGLTT